VPFAVGIPLEISWAAGADGFQIDSVYEDIFLGSDEE